MRVKISRKSKVKPLSFPKRKGAWQSSTHPLYLLKGLLNAVRVLLLEGVSVAASVFDRAGRFVAKFLVGLIAVGVKEGQIARAARTDDEGNFDAGAFLEGFEDLKDRGAFARAEVVDD